MLRASLHTLGCRLNQSESQLLRDGLTARGYALVAFGEPADVGIIQTCTVTGLAEAKARQEIRRFTRRNPEAFTAVIGCYAETGARELATLGGIDLIVGNQDKMAVLDHLGLGKNESPVVLRERISRDDFSITFAGERPFPQRANLKVQDGCSFVCSFCIIPRARGPARSRDWENTLAEARSLVARGVRELVLTGVNIGTYESGGNGIVELVDALDEITGLDRIRISSIEPTTVPPELLERMADPRHRLMPFLHLPLQSGCDEILSAMRRRYTVAEYLAFAQEAHRRVPDLCLGTDLLVGFPGETEAMFDETCQVFAGGPFAYTHVFSYSERPGTLAARAEGAVPIPERQRRSAFLRRLSEQQRRAFAERHLGQTVSVLFENPQPMPSTRRVGRHENAPKYAVAGSGPDRRTEPAPSVLYPGLTENYVRVVVVDPGVDLRNELVDVQLDRCLADFVEGRLAGPVAT